MDAKKTILSLAVVGVVAGAGVFASSFGTVSAAENQSSNLFQRVSSILGIEESVLNDAFTSAHKNIIEEKVESGELDKERADMMLEHLDEDGFNFGYKGEGRPQGWHGELHTILSDYGITRDMMMEAHQNDQTLLDVLEAQGIDIEEFKATLISEMTEHIQTFYEEGRIDEATRDEKLASLDEKVDELLNHAGPPQGEIMTPRSGFGGPGERGTGPNFQ
ncbi:hypothetical protein KC717_03430 [Candidatus Dojkabacteria bacterium]|uniref:DUF2680 domain-containing protein n=1 Tax=Candidatus Dojkabacteria bacterium TaxID=2099670 RepID=A0A955RKD7_9BACT|nr:hypothetical protein [Candidatus Dojkabacteria bacterium]